MMYEHNWASVHGVDPGSKTIGLAELEVDEIGNVKRVFCKELETESFCAEGLINEYSSCRMVLVEGVAHYGTGMPAGKSVFNTCILIGQIYQSCIAWGVDIKVIHPKEVKVHHCGSARAKDSNVRQAIIDRFGGEDVAIGGKKCRICKGKGWVGRGRPHCDSCRGGGFVTPEGILHSVKGHAWSALAVALYGHDNSSAVSIYP